MAPQIGLTAFNSTLSTQLNETTAWYYRRWLGFALRQSGVIITILESYL